MWKLTIEDDEGKQTALPLAHEEYGLGRGESNTIRLTDRNISRTHAILKKTGPAWFLKDLQSYNGTFVNNLRVVGEQGLNTGDLIQIGDYRLELVDDATLPVPVMPGAPPALAPPHQRPNRLVVVVGPTPGAEYPLDKDNFTVGRSEEATISINHSSVSRVHAELIAIGNGRFEIVDKASANGIRVNGVELKRGILEAGDALELGDVRLRFVGAGKVFRTGVDQSQQLAAVSAFDNGATSMVSSSSAKPGASVGKLVGLGVGVGAMLIAAILMLVRPNTGPAVSGASPMVGTEQAVAAGAELLKQATDKLAAKDIEGAHRKIQEIPESSPVRDDPAVKDVEGAWADSMFAKVEPAPDSAAKKAILRTVSATPTVDAERRKKAADMLREIEANEPPPPPPVYQGGGEALRAPSASPPASSAAVASAAPVATAASTIPTGLAAEDAQRKALEPKVFGGHGTLDDIRMLKAICSHLGNRDCRDRAAALLRKKLDAQP